MFFKRERGIVQLVDAGFYKPQQSLALPLDWQSVSCSIAMWGLGYH